MKTIEDLKQMQKSDVMEFIRETLGFKEETSGRRGNKNHLRFEMSGYENKPGECTIWNQSVLNSFSYLGLYDYTEYLFLDFYKGTGTLYYKIFGDDINSEESFGGWGTTDIIYRILELTILSGCSRRRRN